MKTVETRPYRMRWLLLALVCVALLTRAVADRVRAEKPAVDEFAEQVRPLLTQYCLDCHSTKKKKGDLDLERFATVAQVRKDVRPWQVVLEMLDNGEMPPKKNPQPKLEERRRLATWVRSMLDAEARARAGDPGRVIVRRLSNAEYNNSIRDLTGVDLQPARDFPADGAAGEGFTNAGDALVMSPTLLNKYLNAAKEIASHAVLLPDGVRFSPTKTRRDWSDESVADLRQFYAQFSPDGQLPLRPYLAATVARRDDLSSGKTTLEAVAAAEKLNAKYLRVLWQVLNDAAPSYPLDGIRARWRAARPADVESLLSEIVAWQTALWRTVPIGSYRYGNVVRQLANDPTVRTALTLNVQPKPAPGQREVMLRLSADQLPGAKPGGQVVWDRPRFEGTGVPPLLLRDYPKYGARFEVDYAAVFADTAKYLAAVAESANDRAATPQALADKHGLDAALLRRWIELLALAPAAKPVSADEAFEAAVPAIPMDLLPRKTDAVNGKAAVWGWRAPDADLPVLVTNASDAEERIPGRLPGHAVAVHPDPTRFVAAAWESPAEGPMRIEARVTHAHPGCGNGIAWRLEHRRAGRSVALAEGALDQGREARIAPRERPIVKGDQVVLSIDARNGDHGCDLTEIALTVTETTGRQRAWDLARDVADTVGAGNPHDDKAGNKGVWRFALGPSAAWTKAIGPAAKIPADSVLAAWRSAATDAKRRGELAALAGRTAALLAGNRPADDKHPERALYDALVSLDGPLLRGIDPARLKKTTQTATRFSLDRGGGLAAAATSVVEWRLPAALFRDRAFVVDVRLDPAEADRVVRCRVATEPQAADAAWDGRGPFLATPGGPGTAQLLRGFAAFRQVFPQFISFSRVIPEDEVVCLKMYHREDEPLVRLFLDGAQTRRLDQMWERHRFITRQPVVENEYLPQFIGFVTQDQPKELLAYFESQREPFRQRAEQFQKDYATAVPRHFEALAEFAARAYRRPLEVGERAELQRLYDTVRAKGSDHEESLRTTLTRVLVSPSFLFRVERTAAGNVAQPVSDWELATRLSYFLWASVPDAELRRVAADLHDPHVLAAQTARMLKDARVRGLAVEFGTQWLHVRDFRANREKNEKLFPTFDDNLRAALFEESALFFQELFQGDRPFRDILDADWTFLNEALAKHYGIPGVAGPAWRRVAGVKQYGRGGILALASVLAQQSGASRTSPVLRGNWLVEVLLGEKLPKPPPDVPKLPEDETSGDGLTVRQLVEKHARVPECAVCHQRIDPFGFALERYDPIGRFRDKDAAGRPVDAAARLRDGTTFDGLDGLRRYLLTQRGDEFQRHFCRKLLGYALGRAVTLSDQPLIDEMLSNLKKNDGRLSAAVLTVVGSQQFRNHRGLDATKDE